MLTAYYKIILWCKFKYIIAVSDRHYIEFLCFIVIVWVHIDLIAPVDTHITVCGSVDINNLSRWWTFRRDQILSVAFVDKFHKLCITAVMRMEYNSVSFVVCSVSDIHIKPYAVTKTIGAFLYRLVSDCRSGAFIQCNRHTSDVWLVSAGVISHTAYTVCS